VDRVVLGAFTYKGDNSPTLTERAKGLEFLPHHNRRLRDRAMSRSIFTRDKPGTTDPAIAEFLADEELKYGDQVPDRTYLDMTSTCRWWIRKRLLAPVMLVARGIRWIGYVSDISDFFGQLPNGDRQFVIRSGWRIRGAGAESPGILAPMHAFLSMPKPARR